MPWTGVDDLRITVRSRRVSPRPLSVWRCRSVQPLKLPDMVMRIMLPFSTIFRSLAASAQLRDLTAAGRCDLFGGRHLRECVHRRLDDILWVRGAQGFGQGNFQALFESLEKAQAARGNL